MKQALSLIGVSFLSVVSSLYLVQALPSEKATDTIHKKIEKLIVKDLQKKPGNPGFLASE